ncbi:DUF106 domain-containing protein [Candidatus Woesearchaeota archaeon]|nr:DUF106 domain-containing protein [Candidatus Woesearchaeota archaeon]
MFENLLNPVFDPLLRLQPFYVILMLSLGITVVMTMAYKYLTDQKLMKQLKDELKMHQDEMKKHKEDPKKMMELQKKAMQTNMQYMTHSFKPTLFTLIPLIIIFGWMNANLAFAPIYPASDFSVTAFFPEGSAGSASLSSVPELVIGDPDVEIADSQATWDLKGNAGEYVLTVSYDGKEYHKELLIDNYKYAKFQEIFKNEKVKIIQINNPPNKPLGSISIFGWHPGWLGTYIILSLVFSIVLRKLLKVV